MKQFKKLLLIAVFTLGVVGAANAQKIGHIDTNKLVQEMPETAKMIEELSKTEKTLKDDIEAAQKAFQDKLKRFEAEYEAQTPETNQKRAQEAQQDEARIKQAFQAGQGKLAEKSRELMEPIREKALKAIKDVADAKGITYVFDTAGLIVFDKGIDLYDAVKAKLGF